jgi:hypothetical protein
VDIELYSVFTLFSQISVRLKNCIICVCFGVIIVACRSVCAFFIHLLVAYSTGPTAVKQRYKPIHLLVAYSTGPTAVKHNTPLHLCMRIKLIKFQEGIKILCFKNSVCTNFPCVSDKFQSVFLIALKYQLASFSVCCNNYNKANVSFSPGVLTVFWFSFYMYYKDSFYYLFREYYNDV